MCITVFYLEVMCITVFYLEVMCITLSLLVMQNWWCVFLPPNTAEHPELLKTTTERIKTIIEHLKVTTEHIFFITIQEFLISCWETKFYHKTSKNADEHFFFITMCTFSLNYSWPPNTFYCNRLTWFLCRKTTM
jgi:hypothetical protein